jgi:AraC-like DNA-binding protein
MLQPFGLTGRDVPYRLLTLSFPNESQMSETPWLQVLMNRCQIVAGRVCDLPPHVVIWEMQALVADFPSTLNEPEQLVADGVLSRFLLGMARTAGLDYRAEVAAVVLTLHARPPVDGWRERWARVTASCAELFESERVRESLASVTPRVALMLRILDAQFADSSFGVAELACAARMSPSHAVRILKTSTGFGVVGHLRQRRVALARRLLETTSFSMKEVAAAAGYSNTSHFCRQFKLICGCTPVAYRRTGGRDTSARVTSSNHT